MATVMSSLTGLQQNPYLDAEEEIGETGDHSGAQVEANLLNATLPSQVHVSSTLNQYFPTLDEAVYRETWKLQALLDASNVPATAQDTILKSLFGDSPEHRTDHLGREDYRGWGLGQLLRHACSDWTGGELGLRVLRSVNSIHDVYKSAGMPKVVRWRLCIGEEGLVHETVAYGPSCQEEYMQSRGNKCSCQNKPSSGLQRDCASCSEKCLHPECKQMRKKMIPFDYISVSDIIRNLCSSRTYCHNMLEMWRCRSSWLASTSGSQLKATYPITEWWDGVKAKELVWFSDSSHQFELPVLCRNCWEVYPTLPERCSELADPDNFDMGANMYIFVCHSCGEWIECQRKFAKGDPRNIALMGYWDGFQSASSVMRSTWIVGLKIINAGSSSNIPSMPVLFIPNTKSESLGKVDLLGAAIDPFIQETLRMFVDGIEVDYAYPSHLIDNTERLEKKITLRCILVMFSGDHPTQCKFTGFCNSGWKGCKRCHLAGKWRSTPGRGVGGIVEYVENRKQYRFPPEREEMHQMREAADNIVTCDTGVQRKKVSRKTGVIEKTKAYRLHKCMMFDLVRDTTYDILHLLALCLFKKFIQYLKAVTEEDEE
ncbi:hypothetical protein R1sor_017829 [Riccia sorocarpa]|uniref:N-acetyltransferase domain-containing protein n=1 Tax=Riccia sorocarpa TaxID=122646 RepID=A0ABD3IC07_9MARC